MHAYEFISLHTGTYIMSVMAKAANHDDIIIRVLWDHKLHCIIVHVSFM